ncbi:MAG: hypothetical protein HQ536_01025 [Parcubacteria group bacterium]|nr:hypothetical protein [Parcubacteria group bacterium]
MATQETTIEIVGGPSREDLIFRGLCDGQKKTIKCELGNCKKSFPAKITCVESIKNYPDRHLSGAFGKIILVPEERHEWIIKGSLYVHPYWVSFTAEYNSQSRKGKIELDNEESLTLLF